MKGAELVVSGTKQQGIETVFGYPGCHHANLRRTL